MADSTLSAPQITQLLNAWSEGDRMAGERLAPILERELHRVAARYMAGERPGHTLQTTALVNEVYLRLIEWKSVEWHSRAHFFGVAAQIMRRILVDYARQRNADKRGADAVEVSLSEAAEVRLNGPGDLVALDEALQELEKLSARQSRTVELRFFGGLSLEETAEVLGVSVGTVRRDWSMARAWLFRELSARGRQ